MSLAGLGAVCIWHDLLPEARDDFDQWHNREHMPERVGIPGFRRGRRYVAVASTPERFLIARAPVTNADKSSASTWNGTQTASARCSMKSPFNNSGDLAVVSGSPTKP